jgi:tRNA U34 5-carboxymethylaminomethyl modifying enzyme MnmG/GidA
MSDENDLVIYSCGHIMSARGMVLTAGTFLSAKRVASECLVCRRKHRSNSNGP